MNTERQLSTTSTATGVSTVHTQQPSNKRTPSYLYAQSVASTTTGHCNQSYSTITNTDSEPPTYFEAIRSNDPAKCSKPQQPSVLSDVPSSITTANTAYSNFTNETNLTYEEPRDYLAWSIFTTFYCLFIGLIAIAVSYNVRRFNSQGKFSLAYTKSIMARNLNLAAVFFGFIYVTIGFLLFFFKRPF